MKNRAKGIGVGAETVYILHPKKLGFTFGFAIQ